MADKARLKKYGKYLGTAAVAAGLGAGGVSYADAGQNTQNQDKIAELNEQVNNLQQDKDELETDVTELQTTVATKDNRVSELETQVEELENTKEELSDDLAEAQDRDHMLDFLPYFADEDVEFYGVTDVEVDSEADEGEYDRVRAQYEDQEEGHDYYVDVRAYEYGEDAEERVDDVEDAIEDYEDVADEQAFVYREGNVVVYGYAVEGEGDENDFDRQYEDLESQY